MFFRKCKVVVDYHKNVATREWGSKWEGVNLLTIGGSSLLLLPAAAGHLSPFLIFVAGALASAAAYLGLRLIRLRPTPAWLVMALSVPILLIQVFGGSLCVASLSVIQLIGTMMEITDCFPVVDRGKDGG